MAGVNETISTVFPQKGIDPINIPDVPWDLVFYNKERDGDLYKDYEQLGGTWINKKDPFKYLSDLQMGIKKKYLNLPYLDHLATISDTRNSLYNANLYKNYLDEVTESYRKNQRREKLLEDAVNSGQKAVEDFQRSKLNSYVSNSDNDDSYRPYINDWKKANDLRAKTINDHIYKYMKDNPETDGVPLFDDSIYLYFTDLANSNKQGIEDGVKLSTVASAAMLPVAIGGFGLSTLSNLGKTYLATNHPVWYAAAQTGTGALNTKWAYDGAKDIIQKAPEVYNKFETGAYKGKQGFIDSATDLLDLGLDGIFALGGYRGLKLYDKGIHTLKAFGAAKLRDKGIYFGKKYGAYANPYYSGWFNDLKQYRSNHNLINFDKERPMLVNLGLGMGFELANP